MKQKRILFLTNAELGQANVHLAVLQWLQSNAADVDLHLSSFPALQPSVNALNETASPNAQVTFHELSGPTWKECLFYRPEHQWQEICSLPPTVWSVSRAAPLMPRVACPWSADELLDLIMQVKKVVQTVDADLVMVDNLFTPAVTVCYDIKPRWSILSPNTYREFILGKQPRYESFWKHPPVAMSIWEKTEIYYSDWGRISFDPPEGLKVFLPSNSTVDFPFSVVPEHYVSCGPMVRSAPPLKESDAELDAWIRQRSTVYINLGTHFLYDDSGTMSLAASIKSLLDAATEAGQDIQVLWKLNKGDKSGGDYAPLHQKIGYHDRVRIVDWLLAEPISILTSGAVICSVNHGGANSYFEAVSAGVPQVVLPVWFDTYDFARRVEYFGIGKIGNYHSAPKCSESELSPILKQVVLGRRAEIMRSKAAAMAEACKTNGDGCAVAAQGILNLALSAAEA
ncbi:UDPGT family protein [Metarhizium robertsii]|uniref:UDPGT family protein n=1 Tax=Metarhizium robertsii TaxID=568076 RepID=A0A014MZC1_9HYPO|nr:UDPGT family protein [Metarhizium robertsii]